MAVEGFGFERNRSKLVLFHMIWRFTGSTGCPGEAGRLGSRLLRSSSPPYQGMTPQAVAQATTWDHGGGPMTPGGWAVSCHTEPIGMLLPSRSCQTPWQQSMKNKEKQRLRLRFLDDGWKFPLLKKKRLWFLRLHSTTVKFHPLRLFRGPVFKRTVFGGDSVAD